MASFPRIAVTGIGILSPAGVRSAGFREGIRSGGSFFQPIRSFPTEDLLCTRAAEIDGFRARDYLDRKGLRTLSRSALLLCSASALALEDARLEIGSLPGERFGIAAGTGFGNVKSMVRFLERVGEEGPRFVEATLFPNTVLNLPAGLVSIFFGFTGPNTTVSSGTASGLEAMHQAVEMLCQDQADLLLAGGFEEFSRWLHLGFLQAGRLAPDGQAVRPFDRNRRGFLLGEGAAVLVLELEERARRRGARIRGFLRGYGVGFAPAGPQGGEPAWIAAERKAILGALTSGGAAAGDLAFLSASANGSVPGDRCEALAIGEALGDAARTIPVIAIKSVLGECWGASGTLQVAGALLALEEQRVPPMVGFERGESACPLQGIPTRETPLAGRLALVNSFNGRGTNASLLLEKAD